MGDVMASAATTKKIEKLGLVLDRAAGTRHVGEIVAAVHVARGIVRDLRVDLIEAPATANKGRPADETVDSEGWWIVTGTLKARTGKALLLKVETIEDELGDRWPIGEDRWLPLSQVARRDAERPLRKYERVEIRVADWLIRRTFFQN